MAIAGSLTLLITFAFGASSASAHRSPSLSWSISHTVDTGQPIAFSWAGSRLGRKHRLVVQRQVGTAHTWKTALRLPAASGSSQLPGLPLGRYKLRIADLSWIGRVLAQRTQRIGVFGQVPFTTLFSNSTRVYSTPTSTFPYVARYYDSNVAFTVGHNHCKAVHIAFVPGSFYSGATGVLTLVQETRDPVSASVPSDVIGVLDAELVSGQSWSVGLKTAGGESEFYINGYAVCDSTASFFS